MGKSKNKFGVVSIVVLAVLGVALIMGIVGLCLDWLTISMNLGILGSMSESGKIGDIADGEAAYQAVEAFAIIAVLAAAGTLTSYLVSKFVNVKALKFVTIALSVLLIVSALLALILTYTVKPSVHVEGMEYAAAVGCWLLSVFGILGGAAGIVGGLKG